MSGFPQKQKNFFNRFEKRHVTVLLMDINNQTEPEDRLFERLLHFRISDIEEVVGIDDCHSKIFLRSGEKIPVSLSYTALKQQLYAANTTHVDLTPVTGRYSYTSGDEMPDGTIFVGLMPPGDALLLTTTSDLPAPMTFDVTRSNIAGSAKLLYDDWRLPTKEELLLLIKNKDKGALKNSFNAAAEHGWYWSSTQSWPLEEVTEYIKKFPEKRITPHIWSAHIKEGDARPFHQSARSNVRPVRSVRLGSNLFLRY